MACSSRFARPITAGWPEASTVKVYRGGSQRAESTTSTTEVCVGRENRANQVTLWPDCVWTCFHGRAVELGGPECDQTTCVRHAQRLRSGVDGHGYLAPLVFISATMEPGLPGEAVRRAIDCSHGRGTGQKRRYKGTIGRPCSTQTFLVFGFRRESVHWLLRSSCHRRRCIPLSLSFSSWPSALLPHLQ